MCTGPCLRGEEFISGRIVDHPDQTPPVTFDAHRYSIDGKSVGEICCAVERIDNPMISGRTLNIAATLFRKDAMGWVVSLNMIDNALLCRMIRVSDQIDEVFVLDAKTRTRVV